MNKEIHSTKDKVFTSLKIIAGLWLLISLASLLFFSYEKIDTGNIAVIPLHGVISVSEGSAFGSGIVSSEEIIDLLEKAQNSPNIKVILLDINSPGGSPVATDEIAQKVKSLNKTTIAVIREVGASGAYWVASSADYIFANRLSATGSIGVIASYLDFSGLIHEYNVTYQRYVSGNLKDMGTPFREPTAEERKLFQQILDKIRIIFIKEVAINRHMSFAEVEKLATGQIYLGLEAKELKLVDELGTKEDALKYIEKEFNISADTVEYTSKKSLSEILSSLISKFSPQIKNFLNPSVYFYSYKT